jgi:hypothetical protein
MANDNIPVGIDYTSRDYYSLREDLLNRVRLSVNANAPANRRWTGTDPSDFGVALVEAFAYMGDILNYYIDRVANESYLPTASQRQNVINLAELYGYRPAGYRAAYLLVRFSNQSASPYTLPAGTQVSGQVIVDDLVQEVIFTTLQEVIVPAAVGDVAGTASVGATHTEDIALRSENLANPNNANDIAGEFVASSTGEPNQTYALQEDQIVDGSIKVYVQNGDTYEPWTQVVHLGDFGPSDAVFSVKLDADNISYIIFGDGVSGAVPAPLANIKVTYDVGGGEIGNCSIGVLSSILRVPGISNDSELSDLNYFMLVTNTTTGIGGVSPESTSSIRQNAPKLLSAINRAVSLTDYQNLVLAVPNVGKAKAEAETSTAVNLFVSPQRNEGSNDAFPGYDEAGVELKPEWMNLKSQVEGYLADKTQIGVSVTVSPPSYVPVSVTIKYTKLPQYTSTQVESALKLRLLNEFSYSKVSFGDTISPEDIEFQLKQVEGVKVVQVTDLSRTVGNTLGINALIGAPNEIFVFQEAGITVSEASSVATLLSLSIPVGTTLSPTFSSNFFTYNLVGVTTDSIILTPTATNTTATVTINGNPISTPIDTPAGQVTTIPVIVTAGNNTTYRVYSIIVSRA